jgi:hypothetical protein
MIVIKTNVIINRYFTIDSVSAFLVLSFTILNLDI